MLSNKPSVRNLVEICAKKGIEQVIISPGSRNAPLVISFKEHGHFDCLSVPDERAAAFFALGIAQQSRKPVIITCTSGSAALNFAPAIAEAFYQKIPLLIITADRPTEWIHQGEGQSIQQVNVFANYIKRSYSLAQEAQTKDDLWSNNRMICEAIDQCTTGSAGPVHINIPFREPLYDIADYEEVRQPKLIETFPVEKRIATSDLTLLKQQWQQASKKMIVAGLLPLESDKKRGLNKKLAALSADPSLVLLTENTSNLSHKHFINDFDSVLSTVTEEENADFQPDLLITIGGSFISKRIKLWLRKHPPKAHWHIEEIEYHIDTFQALTQTINMNPTAFFRQFKPKFKGINKSESYQQLWITRSKIVENAQKSYFKLAKWSDLQASKLIFKYLPKFINLHLANSTPVRYAQLFKTRKDIIYNANRGVAGIDGSTSTAAGAAYFTGKQTVIITGDISFFYDSNAFWQHHLTENLRIILINNSGGNIFRFIKGPDTTKQLETYFEAHQQRSAKYIAKTFNLNYFVAENAPTLKKNVKQFYKKQKNGRPAILEIRTPRIESAAIWRRYYAYLLTT